MFPVDLAGALLLDGGRGEDDDKGDTAAVVDVDKLSRLAVLVTDLSSFIETRGGERVRWRIRVVVVAVALALVGLRNTGRLARPL